MSKNDDNSAEDRESIAKKIWLAGLGAYGQRLDEAVGRYNKVNAKTSQLFGELVDKGSELEEITRSKFEEVKSQSSESLDQRIAGVRQKLGLGESEEEKRLSDIENKLEELTKVVNELVKEKSRKKS